VGAAPPSGRDPRRIRELLATAQGYTVFTRDGRRVGLFIELAEPAGERLAIRHDGVFLWKRRVLPITAVASVSPERRIVVLNVDRRTLSSTLAAPSSAEEAEAADYCGQLQERLARYASVGDAASQRAPEAQGDQRTAARHLLFVSTSHGYVLIEQEGPPPPLGQGIDVPEHSGSFRVAKLAPSPLPNDQRICVYLEQTE
jgi:hypothetical protein